MTAVAIVAAFSGFTAAGEKFTVDAGKSKIEWTGTKSDGKHNGGFKKFRGEADVDMEEPDNSSISIEIDTASLFSDDDRLTGHLKSPDFFNVRKFSTMKFESTKINHADDGKVTITGKLTMIGTTKEIDVPVSAEVSDDGIIELTANFSIDRTSFGMNYGIGKVDKEVKIRATLVLKQ